MQVAPNSSPPLEILKNYPSKAEIYYFRTIPEHSLLDVYSVRDQVHYMLSYTIVGITGSDEPLRLPLPDDIASILARRLLSPVSPFDTYAHNPLNLSKICEMAEEPHVAGSGGIELRWVAVETNFVESSLDVIRFAKHSLLTRSAKNYTAENAEGENMLESSKDVKVGFKSRSRLGIYPALLCLVCLGTLLSFANSVFGQGEMISTILTLLHRDTNSRFDGNPLFIEKMRIDFADLEFRT